MRDYVGEAIQSWRDNVINAQELCDKKFAELKSIVPGLFFEGVILLASRPKLGKTWLLLQISTALANGVTVLVSDDRPPAHGDVLYLNLEDGERRAQRRMTKYFGARRDNWPKRLMIARTWRRVDQGGLDDIRDWCKSVAKPLLVCIDTLKRVRPPKSRGQTDYDADYEACQGLLQLAHDFPGLTFIVAHHDRKMDAEDVFDTVSGTLGLTGGVDTIAVLKRTAQGVSLHVEGRDLLDTVEKAMRFDRETCRWVVLGEAAEVHRSGERTRVLAVLRDGPRTVTEIKAAAELRSRDAADKLLQRMATAGQVERRGHGKYGLPSDPLSDVSDMPVRCEKPAEYGEKSIGHPNRTDRTPPLPERPKPLPAPPVELPDLPAFLDRRLNGLGQSALGPGGPDDDMGYLAGGTR
jgi:hypothetical protein